MEELERIFGPTVKKDLLELVIHSLFQDVDYTDRKRIKQIEAENAHGLMINIFYNLGFYHRGSIYPIGTKPHLHTPDLKEIYHSEMDKIIARMDRVEAFKRNTRAYLRRALSISKSLIDIESLMPPQLSLLSISNLTEDFPDLIKDSILTLSDTEIKEFMSDNKDSIDEIKAYLFHVSLFEES